MYQIKFRAWDKQTKQIITSEQLFHLSQKEDGIYAIGGSINNITIVSFHKDLVLEQYVNQRDKNKKEAYVGDIIKHDRKYYEIKYDKEGMSFYCNGNEWTDDTKLIRCSEVVGNIHQNLELVELLET